MVMLYLGSRAQTTSCICCVVPNAQPTSLVLTATGNNTITGSFTRSSSAEAYIVLVSTHNYLTIYPEYSISYNAGDSMYGSKILSNGPDTSFIATGLNSISTYYFFVFAYRYLNCSRPNYLTLSPPLAGNMSFAMPACIAPAAQPTGLTFNNVTSASISGSFTGSAAHGYVVVRSTSSSLSSAPSDTHIYAVGEALGNGVVISAGNSTTFSTTGLSSNSTYYFFVFAYNSLNCIVAPKYLTSNPLSGNQATSAPACTAPAAQPTGLTFNSITSNSIAGSFTSAIADAYLVIRSTASSLSAIPVNGSVYNAGDAIGGGTVLSSGTSTNFLANGLSSNTTYYFFVYALNNVCIGGPVYRTTSALTGNATTLFPPCVSPATQPSGLAFSNITSSSISGSFNVSGADEYIVISSTSSSLSATPANGTVYNAGGTLGGGMIVSRGSSTTFTATNLSSNTSYYFFVFALNNTNCSSGPIYLTANPLTGSQSTLSSACSVPPAQPANITFISVTYNAIQGSFSAAAGASGYLLLMSTGNTLSSNPVNGVSYTTNSTLGGATVISSGSGTTFSATGLTANTTYYFFVFAYNNTSCTGGPKYLTVNPLSASQATGSPTVSVLNFYFGNLHSHSAYSDGNADDITKTPADDYAFAKNALCMDFLGIAEHNHTGAGMQLSNWQPGLNQAAAATTASFVALCGMEWGTISTGGHVIVYGIDSLIGWEAGQYQVYVAKGVYTGAGGLFDIITRHSNNAFGYCAHPNSSDFNNLTGGSYDAAADDALVGSAVESGPAFSTNTTYTDPGSPMGYLSYYRSLLAKGYKVGPTIDHDNHNMTFGKTATTRLVILSPTLTKENLIASMRQMRFYASEDCSARITYSISNQAMGSVISSSAAPVISVTTQTSATVSSIKLMYGVPGSGATATQLTSTTSGTLTYTDNALTTSATRYYYLDITESDGKQIITSPIWYTRQ